MSKKLIIYGAGYYGKLLYKFLQDVYGHKVNCFCQSSVEGEEVCCGLQVIPMKQLIDLNEETIILIAIADKHISYEIHKRLIDMSLKTLQVYECGDFISANLVQEVKALQYDGREFEKTVCEPYWKCYFEDVDKMKVAKENLFFNLSTDDKYRADKIIDRLKNILYDSEFNTDIFTDEEKHQLVKIEREFYPEIKKVPNQDVWVWDKYKLNSPNFELSVFYYQCGVNLLKNLDRIRSADIIDAGAYIGDSSIVLSDYTEGKVYAFEALEENYKKIADNSYLNKKENVIPVNKALGNANQEKVFYVRANGETGHGMVKRDGLEYKDKIKVSVVKLDDFVKEHNLKIGLIKTDIEGAEQELLQGAEKTIREQKPTLLISIYHTADDFFLIKKKIEDMELGYKFKIFTPLSKNSVLLETILICETEE